MLVGDEYLCYSVDQANGIYIPYIAVMKYDNVIQFREVIKEDLIRINDFNDQTININHDVIPGRWLFCKNNIYSSTNNWLKRFCILRNEYLFLFHSPLNDKPMTIIPLNSCKLVQPDNGEATFNESRYIRANECFEFDVRHISRQTIRFGTLTEIERQEIIALIQERLSSNISAYSDSLVDQAYEQIKNSLPRNSNIVVTKTKLTGIAMNTLATGDLLLSNTGINYSIFDDPHSLPRLSQFDIATGASLNTNNSHNNMLSNNNVSANTIHNPYAIPSFTGLAGSANNSLNNSLNTSGISQMNNNNIINNPYSLPTLQGISNTITPIPIVIEEDFGHNSQDPFSVNQANNMNPYQLENNANNNNMNNAKTTVVTFNIDNDRGGSGKQTKNKVSFENDEEEREARNRETETRKK